jgi:hypothetical protein
MAVAGREQLVTTLREHHAEAAALFRQRHERIDLPGREVEPVDRVAAPDGRVQETVLNEERLRRLGQRAERRLFARGQRCDLQERGLRQREHAVAAGRDAQAVDQVRLALRPRGQQLDAAAAVGGHPPQALAGGPHERTVREGEVAIDPGARAEHHVEAARIRLLDGGLPAVRVGVGRDRRDEQDDRGGQAAHVGNRQCNAETTSDRADFRSPDEPNVNAGTRSST